MRADDTNQKLRAGAREMTASIVRSRRRAEMLVLMRGIARRYKNLVNKISRAELNASFIEYELFQLLKIMEESVDLTGEAGDVNASHASSFEPSTNRNKPLRYLAESGASSLEISARPDGMAEVRIDGGKRFPLPPALADLMTALSIDNGQREDSFVGWKTVREISDYLAKQSGKAASKRAITQSIYRLRKELFERGGVNPYLVQTNRRRGMRFALRRKIT